MKNLHFWSFWSNLGQMWVNFGQKGPFLKFPKKCENIFFQLQRPCFEQKLGNSAGRFSKKMQKTSIFCHFGPTSRLEGALDFRPFFSQGNCQNTDLNHQKMFWGTLKSQTRHQKMGKHPSFGLQRAKYYETLIRSF